MYSNGSYFTILDHTADLGILVRGSDLKNLFENAANSMIQIMIKGPNPKETVSYKFKVMGDDLSDLLVRFMGEILYLFAGERKIAANTAIKTISSSGLEAIVELVQFDPNIHEITYEIKAVTYHQIEVTEKAYHWEARVIFDL